MIVLDGRLQRADLRLDADVVVIGSGPGGATVAREAALAGASVVVIEEGPWARPEDFASGAFAAMSAHYRDMGASLAWGRAPLPIVQGRMVGGGSPINGAICWRLPPEVHAEWLADDPALADALPLAELEEATDRVEARLGVTPTAPEVQGEKGRILARGADALGLAHRPIRRNVVGCEGLGRCLQGCPKGHKQSVDRTLLADAVASGARILSSTTARRIEVARGRATGVLARTEAGARVEVQARHAVVVAASAVHSPALLLASGIGHGPVGHGFSCHPGVSVAARFDTQVRMWEGATQGHEVTGLRAEGIKLEVLGFGLGVLAGRVDGVGRGFAAGMAELGHWLDLGAAIRARAQGRVYAPFGRPIVRWSPSRDDMVRLRRGVRVMADLLLAAGAREVSPGARGLPARMSRPEEVARIEAEGSLNPGAWTTVITHLFGTCRLGSDPRRSVVRPDFRHHALAGLYVADASVFPTNLGVNPQVPIMAMATLAARRMLAGAPA